MNDYIYIREIDSTEFANMYRALANHYLRRFCRRNGYEFREAQWAGGEPGTVALVGDYVIDYDDLRYVVENQIPEKIFAKWYYLNDKILETEHNIRLTEKFTTLRKISLKGYCTGAPLPYKKLEMKNLRAKAKRHAAKYQRNDKNREP